MASFSSKILNQRISRGPYFLVGVILVGIKFGLDTLVAGQLFNQQWSPLNYLIWPNDRTLFFLDLQEPDRSFLLTMMAISLPFVGIGVLFTLYRLRDSGLPLLLVLIFFVPVANVIFLLLLCIIPTNTPFAELVDDDEDYPRRRMVPLRKMHRKLTRQSYWRSGLLSLTITVPLAILAIILSANVFGNYGLGLFVGAPFTLGLTSVLIFGFSRPQPMWACLLVAFGAAGFAGCAMLLLALEGLICLIMAAPIVSVLTAFGAFIGYFIQARPWLGDSYVNILLVTIASLPGLVAAESLNPVEATIHPVRTEVLIDAPRERVWSLVLAFPPLDEPEELLFRCGVAYPIRAEINGSGAGAIRHCIFTTGTFVEPIEKWQPPELLRFRVDEQPEPMRELSPYHIHPPHLDHYLRSHQGQFLLVEQPDGTTRLEGTTWYSNRMWPESYWRLWGDHIIHQIHLRVLGHIKNLAEKPE